MTAHCQEAICNARTLFGELTRAMDNQPNSTPPHVSDGMVMVRVMMM